MRKQYKTAVYIGRFQPIHNAHLETIKKALTKADQLLIFVGTDQRPCNIKNPFTTEKRIEIMTKAIKEYFGEPLTETWSDKPKDSVLNNIKFVGCRDYMYNNYNWSSEIFSKALANGATPDKSTLLIGCFKDDTSYYLKMFPQWAFERMDYLWKLDSTDIRNEVYENGKVDEYKEYVQPSTVEYLNRILKERREEYQYYKSYKRDHCYSGNVSYNPIHNTVDAVVIKSGCLLLVKRKFHPGINQYALPGGFVMEELSLKDSMLKELKEETRITIPKDELRKNIKSSKIFDHPRRSLRGRVITNVYMIDLGYGALPSVKEGSDASGAEWVPMADVMKMEDTLFEDHYDIIINMTSKY